MFFLTYLSFKSLAHCCLQKNSVCGMGYPKCVWYRKHPVWVVLETLKNTQIKNLNSRCSTMTCRRIYEYLADSCHTVFKESIGNNKSDTDATEERCDPYLLLHV